MSDIKRMESSSKKITIIIEVEVFRRVESTHRLELLSCVAGWIFESVRLCNTNLLTGTMSKCVIKANDMSPQMSKFATKVGIEALQAAQTEQVRVTLAVSTCPKMFFFLVVARQQHYPACLPLSFVLVVFDSTNKKPVCTDTFHFLLLLYTNVVSWTMQEAASIIKEQFESLPGGGIWHCLVGRNFGCFVDHQEKHFIYFYIGQIGICIFKTV